MYHPYGVHINRENATGAKSGKPSSQWAAGYRKVKAKLSLYWRMEVQRHAFLTLALEGGEWSASRPCRFAPGERAHGTHWTGGWVGPRAVMGILNDTYRNRPPKPLALITKRLKLIHCTRTSLLIYCLSCLFAGKNWDIVWNALVGISPAGDQEDDILYLSARRVWSLHRHHK
jgi:hypothetical protein